MPRVTVSAKHLDIPVMCVCCGGQPSLHRAATATRSEGTRVVRTVERSFQFPVCGPCDAHLHNAQAPRSANCEAYGIPVRFERWYGSDLTFWFDSGRFATAFARTHQQTGKRVELDINAAPPATIVGAPVAVPGETSVWRGVLWALLIIPVAACGLLMLFSSMTTPGSSGPPPLTAAERERNAAVLAARDAEASNDVSRWVDPRNRATHDAGRVRRAAPAHRRDH